MSAHPTSRLLVLVLGALTAFTPMSVDMYLPAFPEIARDLGARTTEVQLTLSFFFLGLAIGQLIYGPVADRFGRRPPLIFGCVVYIGASLGCALAPDIHALIAFRFLQALGGCVGMVITRSIVRDMFDEKGAARMFAQLMAIMGVAPILAPLLGGQLLVYASWHAIFWILTVFGVLNLIAVLTVLKESLPVERQRSLHPAAVAATYLRLLTDRYFVGHALSSSLSFAGMFAYVTGSPFVFIEYYGVSAQHYGWIFGMNAIGFIGAAQVNHRLLSRTTTKTLLSMALVVTVTAGLAVALAGVTGFGGLPGLLVPLFVFISSMGFITPNATARALAPQGANAGSASAVLGTLQFCAGGAIGAVVASLPSTSPAPMALMIALCGVLGITAHRVLVGRR